MKSQANGATGFSPCFCPAGKSRPYHADVYKERRRLSGDTYRPPSLRAHALPVHPRAGAGTIASGHRARRCPGRPNGSARRRAVAGRGGGQDGLGVLRMRPSCTTDTTTLPSWNTWPLARPRAPAADGDSCE